MTTTNDHTTFPPGIKTQEEFNEWCDYENGEDRIDQNYIECWGDVDKLKSLFPGNEVYLVRINCGLGCKDATDKDHNCVSPPLRAESDQKKRYTFAFDYAVTKLDEVGYFWIWYHIMRYRNEKIDDRRTKIPWNTRVSVRLMLLGVWMEKYPHTQAHFS